MSTAPELRDTPRPVTAWELELALLAALREVDEYPDCQPIPEELAALVARLVNGTADKYDAIAGAFKRREADLEALEARAEDARAKAERGARSLKSFKDYLLNLIELHGGPLAGVQYTIKRQQNAPHVELDELPPWGKLVALDCVRHVPESYSADKKAIAERLKRGESVPGARLVPGEFRVVVK